MNVDSIQNGYVIDHIQAGRAMAIYDALDLGDLDCSVAILMNVPSSKMGRKDIIKIDKLIRLNKQITLIIIKDGKVEKKYHPIPPKILKNVIRCKNPRCITSVEQELPQVFRLTDPAARVYRCIYCETQAKRAEYPPVKH